MLFVKCSSCCLAMLAVLFTLPAVAVETTNLKLEMGTQQVYAHPQPVKRVAVGNPAIANITVLTTHNLLITAKQLGSTEISLWENEQQTTPAHILRIVVSASTAIENQRLEAVNAGTIQAAPAGNGVALAGEATSLEQHALAEQAVNAESKGPLDGTVTSFDNQVQIDIKVVEVSRQNMMRMGLFLGKNRNTTIAVSPPGTLSGVQTGDNGGLTLNSSSGFLPVTSAFNFVFGNSGSGLLSTLSVLEANGFAYTLAEPSLTSISGQSATFLAGGEYPVPIRSGSGADSTVTIQYKEYGIRLQLTPTVLDANRIFLKVSPEVSELDFTNAVQTGGVSVPGLRVRRTDTSVALGNGESFVISGLVSRNTLNNVDKIPGLGNIPIIGAFFRSTRFDREDKELLMVVTPHLVRPIARGAQTPPLPGGNLREYNPSFSELFFQNGPQPDTGLPNTGMSR